MRIRRAIGAQLEDRLVHHRDRHLGGHGRALAVACLDSDRSGIARPVALLVRRDTDREIVPLGRDLDLDAARVHFLSLPHVNRHEHVGRVLGADRERDHARVPSQGERASLVELAPLQRREHLRATHLGVDQDLCGVSDLVALAIRERLERRIAVGVLGEALVVDPHRALGGDAVPFHVGGARSHDQLTAARGRRREREVRAAGRVGGHGRDRERAARAGVAALERVPRFLVELHGDGGRHRLAGVVARLDHDRDRGPRVERHALGPHREAEEPASHGRLAAPAHHAVRSVDHLDLERELAVVGDALGSERHLGAAVDVGARHAGLEHAAVAAARRRFLVVALAERAAVVDLRLEQVVAHLGAEHRRAEEVARGDAEAHLVAVHVHRLVGLDLDAELGLPVFLDAERDARGGAARGRGERPVSERQLARQPDRAVRRALRRQARRRHRNARAVRPDERERGARRVGHRVAARGRVAREQLPVDRVTRPVERAIGIEERAIAALFRGRRERRVHHRHAMALAHRHHAEPRASPGLAHRRDAGFARHHRGVALLDQCPRPARASLHFRPDALSTRPAIRESGPRPGGLGDHEHVHPRERLPGAQRRCADQRLSRGALHQEPQVGDEEQRAALEPPRPRAQHVGAGRQHLRDRQLLLAPRPRRAQPQVLPRCDAAQAGGVGAGGEAAIVLGGVEQLGGRNLVERELERAGPERAQAELHRLVGHERLALEHERDIGSAWRHCDHPAVARLALGDRHRLAQRGGLEALVRDLEPVPAGREIADHERAVLVGGADTLGGPARRHHHARDAGAVGEAHEPRDARGPAHLDRNVRGLPAPHRDAPHLRRPQSRHVGAHRPVARGEPLEARDALRVGEHRRGRRPVAFPPRVAALAPHRDLGARNRRATVGARELRLDHSRAVERDHHVDLALRRGELPSADHEVGVTRGADRERVPAIRRDALERELAAPVGLRAEVTLAAARVRELDLRALDRLLRVGIHHAAGETRDGGARVRGNHAERNRGHEENREQQGEARLSSNHRVPFGSDVRALSRSPRRSADSRRRAPVRSSIPSAARRATPTKPSAPRPAGRRPFRLVTG